VLFEYFISQEIKNCKKMVEEEIINENLFFDEKLVSIHTDTY
jgi:hypothetical protein